MRAKRSGLLTKIIPAVAVIVVLFFVSLLLTEGIGGDRSRGGSEAPGEDDPAIPAPAETAGSGTPEETLEIVSSFGERVPVRVEVANTRAEQDRGLGDRTALAEDAGMQGAFSSSRSSSRHPSSSVRWPTTSRPPAQLEQPVLQHP